MNEYDAEYWDYWRRRDKGVVRYVSYYVDRLIMCSLFYHRYYYIVTETEYINKRRVMYLKRTYKVYAMYLQCIYKACAMCLCWIYKVCLTLQYFNLENGRGSVQFWDLRSHLLRVECRQERSNNIVSFSRGSTSQHTCIISHGWVLTWCHENAESIVPQRRFRRYFINWNQELVLSTFQKYNKQIEDFFFWI